MNKEKLMKIIKSRITVGIFGVLVGAMLCTNSTEDQNKINKYNNVVEENEDLTATNKELQEKVSKSEKYLSLNDNEKDLVDTKIDEVKQATADEIARQKAEKEEAERKAQEEAERVKQEAEANKYETGLTYDDMARDTTGKIGTYGKFEGKIIQVMQGTSYTQYRVAINGDYDKVMLIEISNDKLTSNLLEDDYIYFKGMSMGNVSYKTVLGAKVTVPSMTVDSFTR